MSQTKKIQIAIGKMKVLSFHTPVCENVKYLLSNYEMDVMSVSKSGMMYEYEVKISRSDFKADSKKRKQYHYKEQLVRELTPNYFSYVCPKDLIKLSEIPDYAGLYYYYEDEEIGEIKRPKRLHDFIHDRNKILEKICRINSERQFLGNCRMTYNNKENQKRVKEILGDDYEKTQQ